MLTFSEFLAESINEVKALDEFIGWIVAENLSKVKKEVQKHNQKFGYEVFKVEPIGEERYFKNVKCIKVKVTGKIPTLNNWELVGTIDKTTGLIFNNKSNLNLEQYRTSKICSVCGKAMARNTTWLVKNTGLKDESVALSSSKMFTVKPNEIYEIGSSCMKKLTGNDVFSKINAIIYKNASFDDIITDNTSDEEIERRINEMIGDQKISIENLEIPIEKVLDTAYAIIKKDGFVPSSDPSKATKNELRKHLLFASEIKTIPMSKKIIEKILAQPKNTYSDFMMNCQWLCGKSRLIPADFATAAAMVNTYIRIIQDEATSDGVPFDLPIGTKTTTEIGCKLTGTSVIDGVYGVSHLFEFTDEERHIFHWYCTGSVPAPLMKFIGLTDISKTSESDRQFILKGFTVKSKKISRGKNITVITRAKIGTK